MSNAKFESRNLVTDREFLQPLNTKWDEAVNERFIELGLMNRTAPGKWEIPDSVLGEDVQPVGVKGALHRLAAKNRTIQPLRLARIGYYLRGLVDGWIETGQSEDGREMPASRTLPAYLRFHVVDYLNQFAPFKPFVTDHGIDIEVGDVIITDAAKGSRSFDHAQQYAALRLFVVMLASDWKERICKCRDSRCDQYFLVPVARKAYKGGTFCCHEHHKRTDAARCMRKTRENGERVLIEAAAEWLKDRKSKAEWMQNKRLKRILAERLIAVINRKQLRGYHDRVTLSWVTRHQRAIEERRCALTLWPTLPS